VTTGRGPRLLHVAAVERGMWRPGCCATVPLRHTSSRRRWSYAQRAWRGRAVMSQELLLGGTQQRRIKQACLPRKSRRFKYVASASTKRQEVLVHSTARHRPALATRRDDFPLPERPTRATGGCGLDQTVICALVIA
jgi:hypothetical protein